MIAWVALGIAAFCWWVVRDDRRALSAHRAEVRAIARHHRDVRSQADGAADALGASAGEDEHLRDAA